MMAEHAQEDRPVLSTSTPNPANEELRRKALLALLNYATHEPGPLARCVFDTIEELQEDIGHPLTADQALNLYSALLCAGVEPDYETWCAEERGPFEEAAEASLRLRTQREVLADEGPGEQEVITIDDVDPDLVVGYIVTEGESEKNTFCEEHFALGGYSALRHREVLAPEALAYGLLCGECGRLLVALAKPEDTIAAGEQLKRTNQ